jgi:chorismate mutase
MDEITTLRGQIDLIDEELIALLARRFECARQMADLKRAKKLPVFDGEREAALFQRIGELAQQKGLRPAIAQAVFAEIIHQARRLQAARMAQEEDL